MELHLLEVLVCPLCKSKLVRQTEKNQLICKIDKIAFPIRDGIPIMLESEATPITISEN